MARNLLVTRVQPVIVWFRDDLRLSDHPALQEAASRGAPVIGLYVRDEQSRALKPPAARPPGGAPRRGVGDSGRARGPRVEGLGGPRVRRPRP
ncbi:MAG: deoxyribodipyrimidine photo-lyase, partial [Bradyrhizobium sp.]|uniref:deoxyribodipyrimidine photo-lyase n=1 Tax=Bradyrhizobium sp. TaxID=376 RepID=UPI00391B3E41